MSIKETYTYVKKPPYLLFLLPIMIGINVFDFSLIDNSDVIELLEGRLGLINQLNEECVRPNGGDESFVYKLKVVNSDSRCLLQNKLDYPYEFAIRHYAAPIKVILEQNCFFYHSMCMTTKISPVVCPPVVRCQTIHRTKSRQDSDRFIVVCQQKHKPLHSRSIQYCVI